MFGGFLGQEIEDIFTTKNCEHITTPVPAVPEPSECDLFFVVIVFAAIRYFRGNNGR